MTEPLNIMSSSFTDTVGTWSMAVAEPPADLRGLVSEVWESGGPVCVGHMKLIPRGTVDLIINLGAHQAMYQGGDIASSQTFKHAWISGLFNRPLFVGPELRSQSVTNHLVAISFYPSSVLPVFGIPATELVNRVFDADLLLGSEVLSLRERMLECEDIQSRFSALLNFVRKLHQQLARPAPFSAIWAIQQMRKTIGLERIENLCDELGISRRQLNRQVTSVTGLSPKAYSRLIRFRAIADQLDHRKVANLTDLSHQFGYSDQAHFSREFRSFAGESPREYLIHLGADGEAIFLD